MCGGILYPDAPNCCEEGYFCWSYFGHYHICLQENLRDSLPKGTDVVTPDFTGQCAPAYGICGGLDNVDAPACCEEGYACNRKSPTYHQCIPLAGVSQPGQYPNVTATTKKTTTTTTKKTTTTTTKKTTTTTTTTKKTTTTTKKASPTNSNQECAAVYGMCGGSNYPDAPTCCEPGATCVVFSEFHHQCLPDSAAEALNY